MSACALRCAAVETCVASEDDVLMASGPGKNMALYEVGAILAQEALLPQADRATRHVSRNLVNCCTAVRTSCAANPQQSEVMELEHYGRPSCNKLCPSKLDAPTVVGVVNKLDRRSLQAKTSRTV